MAGWRKAWLTVLERGGSSGSLHVHLHGLYSPSSSFSSLNYKRSGGGKNAYGSHVKGNAVLVAIFVALVLTFFYISAASGPTADASFPSPTAASSPSVLFSWLSSSSASPPTLPRKSLPPHPPIPPAVSTAVQINGGINATMRKQQVLISAEDSVPVESTGQLEATPEQTKEPSYSLNAGNTTMGLNRELVNSGTRAQEQQEEAILHMPSWQSAGEGANSSNSAVIGAPGEFMNKDGPGKLTDISIRSLNQKGGNKNATGDGANSSHSAVIGALGELMDDGGAGNSTDINIRSNQEESSKNATVDAPNSTREKVSPSSMEHKEHKHISMRIIRYKHPRRQKQIFHSGQERAAQQSNGTTVDKKIGVPAGKSGSLMKCDIFSGRWVRDESYPFYPPGSCPHIDDDFNCHNNGRPDSDFLKWRWQPHGCDIPRLNAADFLERLRGQRIIFAGDSLNRNMWESLVCILRHGVRNKRSVCEASGRNQFKTRGYYSFKFKDYNCSVDFVRSIFLVKELIRENKGRVVDAKLKLDELDGTTRSYQTADIVVFNTGHWWTHSKTSRGQNYYQEGNHVYPNLDVMDAFKKALTTWARWVDKNIDSRRTQVVFRGYSLTHFRGGQWNSGGKCHRETEPIFNQTYLSEYPEKMRILENILRQMKTPVIYLNISRLTDYRKDAHPSVYRMHYDTEEERIAAVTRQDCSHWCLPGVPDTWNELLYASLLQASKGSWRL